jgi:hypothetical protein
MASRSAVTAVVPGGGTVPASRGFQPADPLAGGIKDPRSGRPGEPAAGC